MRVSGTSADDLCTVVVRCALSDVTVYTVGWCGVSTQKAQCIPVGLQRRLFGATSTQSGDVNNLFVILTTCYL